MAPERQTQTLPETEPKKSQGQIVRDLRGMSGKSQSQLAKEAEISQGYLSQIENDDPNAENPGYRQVIGLAEALGVGINFDLGQQEQKAFVSPQALRIHDALYPEELRIMLGTLREKFNIEPEDVPVTYIDHSPSHRRIGDRISNLRLNHPDHPPQRKIASQSGTSQGYLSQVENSLCRNPSMTKLRPIAKALDTNIYDLLEIKEVEYPPKVAYLDRFFRSSEVPSTAKRELLKLVGKMEAVSKKSSST